MKGARFILWVLFAHFALLEVMILVVAIRNRDWGLGIPCSLIVLLVPGLTVRIDELLKRAGRVAPRVRPRARRRPLRVPVDGPSESPLGEARPPAVWPLLVALGAILIGMALMRWAS